MKNLILLFIICGAGWQFYQHSGQSRLGAGVYAPNEPRQKDAKHLIKNTPDGYKIMSLAKFKIKAKVLSRKNQNSDKESEISPVDFTLGWGRMSDESVIQDISFSHSGRFVHWRSSTMPIPQREIETHATNTHLIPANDAVKDALDTVKKYDIVELKGNLVKVTTSSGFTWQSSLTRDDVGDGACEIIYVKSVRVVNPKQQSTKSKIIKFVKPYALTVLNWFG